MAKFPLKNGARMGPRGICPGHMWNGSPGHGLRMGKKARKFLLFFYVKSAFFPVCVGQRARDSGKDAKSLGVSAGIQKRFMFPGMRDM